MNALRLSKYIHELEFTADTVLPPFTGNTIRGAIGSALNGLGSTAYDNVFKADNVDSIPNPYVISVPYPSKGQYKKGDTLPFSITLFGDACSYAADLTSAARRMCNGKLANCTYNGNELIYDKVWSDNGAESIPDRGAISIVFLTPAEIFNEKEPAVEVSFNRFIDSLFGRICDIINNYTGGEFILPYALIARRPLVYAEYNLKTVKFQTSGQPVDSIMGTVNYFGDITRYLPYIDLGSQIHIGKKTTRACGEYRFEI